MQRSQAPSTLYYFVLIRTNRMLKLLFASDFKKLPLFAAYDWDKVHEMEPPFVPQPENDTDTCYFEGLTLTSPLLPFGSIHYLYVFGFYHYRSQHATEHKTVDG